MKSLVITICLLISVAGLQAQNDNSDKAAQIRQEMAKIRRSTNWDDPKAVAKANEQILNLSKQLIQLQSGNAAPKKTGEDIKQSDQKGGDQTPEGIIPQYTLDQEYVMQAAIRAGSVWADVHLAEGLRKVIVKEYEEDRTPKVSNPAYFDEITTLIIDFSKPESRNVAGQLDKFKSVKNLILTGGKIGASINLNDVLMKSAALPLEKLYIIDFKAFLTDIPETVGNFKKLKSLGLFNNRITRLPVSVGALPDLTTLYVDANPITTLVPAAESLKKLTELGIGKTMISSSEQERLHKILPNCKILTK